MWRNCNTSIRSCRLDPDTLQHESVLQTNETTDQTDTETHEGSNGEHQKQRLAGDNVDIIANPRDGFRDDQRDIRQNSSHV